MNYTNGTVNMDGTSSKWINSGSVEIKSGTVNVRGGTVADGGQRDDRFRLRFSHHRRWQRQ